jgi:hypothetical protein
MLEQGGALAENQHDEKDDLDEPEWLRASGELLSAPTIQRVRSEHEPEWLSNAASTLMNSPVHEDADARAAAAEARAAQAEAEVRRLKNQLRAVKKERPVVAAAASSADNGMTSCRPHRKTLAALGVKLDAARDAGDEEQVCALLQEAAIRAMQADSPAQRPTPKKRASSGRGKERAHHLTPESNGQAACPVRSGGHGTDIEVAVVEVPQPATRRPSRFKCPECGGLLKAVLPNKVTTVRCECGATFPVQRPPKKQPSDVAPRYPTR